MRPAPVREKLRAPTMTPAKIILGTRGSELALTHGVWRLHELRSLLRTPTEQNQFEFVQTHPLIRDLSHYEALVPDCFASEHQQATATTP